MPPKILRGGNMGSKPMGAIAASAFALRGIFRDLAVAVDRDAECLLRLARSAGAMAVARARQSCSMQAAHQRALWRDARTGRSATRTVTGLVCICGKYRR